MTPPPATAKADGPGNEPLILAGGDGRGFGGRIGTALQSAWQGGEDRLLRLLLGVSVVVHLLVFLLHDLDIMRLRPLPLPEDGGWTEVLLPDTESMAPPKTALPNAAPAPEAKVPEQMLPQLPTKVAIKEQAKPEDEIADEKIQEKLKAEEEAKRLEAEKKRQEALELQRKKEEDNKMELAELQKRAALEKLRKENKTAKQMEAPTKDPLAAIQAELAKKQGKLNKGLMSAAMASAARAYGAKLKAAIQQNYSIPEAYNLKGATLKVGLAIAVNGSGDLVELRVEESSGDPGFDALTMDAVRASVPLPPPPPDMAGQAILLNFTP